MGLSETTVLLTYMHKAHKIQCDTIRYTLDKTNTSDGQASRVQHSCVKIKSGNTTDNILEYIKF